MKLDIYVDGGLRQDKLSIGVVFYVSGIELYRISELIPDKLNITDIQNAELYAIDKALSICKEASISNKEIFIHCDNQDALTTASAGKRFKNCSNLLLGHVNTYKGQLTKNLKNTLYFLKISSTDNHGKAHDAATEALIGNPCKKGYIHYLALSSKEIKKRLDIKSSEDSLNNELAITEIENSPTIDTLDVTKIFNDVNNSLTKLQDELFKKKKKLIDLKIYAMKEKAQLNHVSTNKQKYIESLITLKESVLKSERDKELLCNDITKNEILIKNQLIKIEKVEKKILENTKKLKQLSTIEEIRLSIYQDEYERLIQEIEYIKSLKNIKCEVM